MESIKWVVILLILSPFILYGAGQFAPQYDSFIVTSGSMEPEIQTGALLFTTNTPAEDIRVGDTITFREGDTHTTHKVIEVKSSNGITFETQGVANAAADPGQVTEEELVGKKLFSIPFLGYAIAWGGTTQGFILLVVIPGIILLLVESKNIYSQVRDSHFSRRSS